MGRKERIPEEMSGATRQRWEDLQQRKDQQFIAAIPLAWLRPAFALNPSATKVALAVWYQTKRSKSPVVPLGSKLLEEFGVGRKAGYRALEQLQAAGLVEVERESGRLPRVTVRGPTEV